MNSMQMAPERLTSTGNFSGLATILRNLSSDNWTVFVVKGDRWPKPAPRNQGAPASNWVDPNNPPADPNDELAFGNKMARKEPPKYEAFGGSGQRLGGSSSAAGGAAGGAAGDVTQLSEDEQLAMALSLSQQLAAQVPTEAQALTLD